MLNFVYYKQNLFSYGIANLIGQFTQPYKQANY